MEVLESFTSPKFKEKVSACIGVFDGVHLGHQSLLKTLTTQDKPSVVITFKNHPKALIKKSQVKLIHPFNQRLDYLQMAGVNIVLALEFDEAMQKMTAKEFLNECSKLFEIDTFVTGYDTSLGIDQVSSLESYLPNARIIKVPPVIYNGVLISSQKIREEIANKNFQQVAMWLGKNYSVKLDLRERLNEKSGEIFVDDLCMPSTEIANNHLSTYPFLNLEF